MAGEREFYSGYAGSLPTDPEQRAGTYFDNPRVRALIFTLEEGPVSRKRVTRELKGTGFSLEDLVRVKLIRQEGKRYYIGFNYFTARDMVAVIATAKKQVPSLVQAYLDRAAEFNRLFDLYPVDSVAKDRLAFVLIAGFSFNWDGLKITRDEGYRRPVLVEGDGFRYSFWASEDVPNHDTHGFYWGSSTLPAGPFNYSQDPVDWAFSSFGDPYSDPRMDFPDLLLRPADKMASKVRTVSERIGLIHDTSFGGNFDQVLGLESGRDFAALLFALRGSPRERGDLAQVLREPAKVEAYLDLLVETQYIDRDAGENYHLLIPVLDRGDRQMVEQGLALSRQILSTWLKENYPIIREELGTLTAMRHGVPIESLFTQIWHELFGLATRELVASGFLFDPAGPEIRYKGSYSTLWRHELYDYDLE
jgi:hypothetical protein